MEINSDRNSVNNNNVNNDNNNETEEFFLINAAGLTLPVNAAAATNLIRCHI